MQEEDWTYGRLVTWRPTPHPCKGHGCSGKHLPTSPISPDFTVYQKIFSEVSLRVRYKRSTLLDSIWLPLRGDMEQ